MSDQVFLFSSLRDQDTDSFPLQVREPFFHQPLVRDGGREEDLVGDEFALAVVLMEKGSEDLFFGKG